MNEGYNAIQSNFGSTATSQSTREKNKSNRTTSSRSSRMIQQSQQNTYQATSAQQNSGFQPQSQQPQSYAMEIQTVQLTPVPSQSVQISAALNDQSATVNSNQISSIAAAAVQNLVAVQHNFAAQPGNSSLQTQHPAIRPLPNTPPISSKPYKIVQPQQQCYKFPNLVQNLNAQQCKFSTNSFKVKPSYNVCRMFMAEFTTEIELKRYIMYVL